MNFSRIAEWFRSLGAENKTIRPAGRDSPSPQSSKGPLLRKLLTIDGMSCGHCAMKVESELRDVSGVTDAHVDILKKTALVVGESLRDADLAGAVTKAGYRISGITGSR
jgi:copper chaperone CopZ